MQEEFKVLLLNRGNKVIGIYEASAGGLTGTVADPRLILAAAIKSLAVSIILSHNHPSGNLKPSRADEELTQKIKVAANYHDIKVIDHIIITSEAYYSFAEEGLL
jgi:DNA repair protein RadC